MMKFRFNRLKKIIAVLLGAVIIAAIAGFADTRGFEIAVMVYVGVGFLWMLMPRLGKK